MRIDPLRQAAALLMAGAIGLAAGFLYDLLRPPRRRSRGLTAFLPDLLFCLLLGAALFLYAMSFGDGRLGVASLALAWTGFLVYQKSLSGLVFPIIEKVFHIMDNTVAGLKKTCKKIHFSAKKFFKNSIKCFIVRR